MRNDTIELDNIEFEFVKEEKKQQPDILMKVILVGSSSVGKTCLLHRILYDVFEPNLGNTIGVSNASINCNINNKIIKMQIWDTAGTEQYHSVVKLFFKGANFVILIFDLTSRDSFKDLNYWMHEIKNECTPNTQTILVGNKCDDINNFKIQKNEVTEFMENHNFVFYEETSAKSGQNSKIIFIKIAKLFYLNLSPKNQNQNQKGNLSSPKFSQNNKSKEKENCQC